jgi:hypothetical protein
MNQNEILMTMILNTLTHASPTALLIAALGSFLPVVKADQKDAPEPASMIKDYGLKDYVRISKDLPHSEQNPWRLVCELPYNCQFQPWIEVEALADKEIRFNSSNPLVLYLTPPRPR